MKLQNLRAGGHPVFVYVAVIAMVTVTVMVFVKVLVLVIAAFVYVAVIAMVMVKVAVKVLVNVIPAVEVSSISRVVSTSPHRGGRAAQRNSIRVWAMKAQVIKKLVDSTGGGRSHTSRSCLLPELQSRFLSPLGGGPFTGLATGPWGTKSAPRLTRRNRGGQGGIEYERMTDRAGRASHQRRTGNGLLFLENRCPVKEARPSGSSWSQSKLGGPQGVSHRIGWLGKTVKIMAHLEKGGD